MPYSFEWVDEPHICLITLTGDVMPEEIDHWMTHVYGLMQLNPNLLHAVVDQRSHPKINFNVLKMEWVRRAANHPNMGWVVTIGASPLVGFWMEMLRRVARMKCAAYPTIEEGLAFLRDVHQVEEERRQVVEGL
jgi:hypothetical protein